ncbi:outer membrane beta-barrel protein [Puia sp.]|jgi:hypothetical protein|uniref:outer membrane beta-barrel protein n=1 Tax=Puia sp. TaxID=2045100 RepID=UPI002F3E2E80
MCQQAKIPAVLFLLLPLFGIAQNDSTQKTVKPKTEHHFIGIGFRAGLNFANVTSASQINSSSRTGFHAAIFYSPVGQVLAPYSELSFSRQGYDYSTGQTSTGVMLDYLYFAQLMAINITKYVQIQVGARTAYLLNAKKDSAGTKTSTDSLGINSLVDQFHRIDFGATGGLEIHPFAGLLFGARYNISFTGLFKQQLSAYTGGGSTSGSGINPKNNVIQLFIGYRF